MTGAMEHIGPLLWSQRTLMMFGAVGVQLLLLLSSSTAQSSPPVDGNGTEFSTALPTEEIPLTTSLSSSSTLLPALSTQLGTDALSTRVPTVNASAQTASTPSTTNATHSLAVNATGSSTTLITGVDGTTSLAEDTTVIDKTHSSSSASPSSVLNASASLGGETILPTSLTPLKTVSEETNAMTTTGDLVTYELVTEEDNSSYVDVTTPANGDAGIWTESFIRLLIIAGATAGSCLVLLIVTFVIVACYYRRRQKKKNARYYEFKKKNYNSKYERVEQKNSLARRDRPENTPIGGGWVFSSNNYHDDVGDDMSQNVALRSISPLAVATPLMKVHPADDPNGVPDSGHGGSIPPDDYALGMAPSLEEDIEMELNPLYMALGTSIGTGSEARDHSYIGGESDTISEGNEPVVDKPIRDVHFNSFGANGRVASEEAVEL